MRSTDGRTRALIVAHDAKAPGGVNNFLRIMRVQYRDRVDATRISNGPRQGQKTGKVGAATRMIGDYVNFLKKIRQDRFDIVHVNPSLDLSSTPRELLFVFISAVASPSSRRLVFYRGWNWPAFKRIKRSRLFRSLFLFAQSRAHCILVLSPDFKDALVKIGVPAEKVRIMSTMFEGAALAPVLRGTEKKPQILFLSRFLAAKGGAELILAFASLSKSHPEWSIVMAGDGPERQNLEALVVDHQLSDRISFTGYVGGRDKMLLLAESSIFALPTIHPEGMPNAILEAMAAGQVVITTSAGGIGQIIKDGVNGVLLQDNDPTTIARALKTYLTDPEHLTKTGALNACLAWEQWESAVVSGKIAEIYESLS